VTFAKLFLIRRVFFAPLFRQGTNETNVNVPCKRPGKILNKFPRPPKWEIDPSDLWTLEPQGVFKSFKGCQVPSFKKAQKIVVKYATGAGYRRLSLRGIREIDAVDSHG